MLKGAVGRMIKILTCVKERDGMMQEKKNKVFDTLKSMCSNTGRIIFLVAVITIVIIAIVNGGTTMKIIGHFFSVIAPFIVAFFISYLIKPMVSFFERILDKIKNGKALKIKMIISVIISYMIVVGAIAIIIVYIYPQLKESAADLSLAVKNGYNYLNDHVDEFNSMIPFINLGDIMEYIKDNLLDNLMKNSSTIVPYVYRLSSSFLGIIYNIFMGLVISIYMVIDRKQLTNACRRIVYSICPKGKGDSAWRTLRQCNHIFNGFLFGKMIDSLIIGILCFIIMNVLHLPYSLLMSLIVGITNMIPYFGPIIGAIPGVVMYLFIDPKLSLIFAIMILILQQFDGLYLGPKILGDLTGIKPLWVIFGVTAGGAYFGALGMFLGVPAVAVLTYLLNLIIDKKLDKKGIKLPDSK